MTDNEIIKALEICGNNGDCRDCPYDKTGCEFELDALDLINRQKARIENYIELVKGSQSQTKTAIEQFDQLKEVAYSQKAEIERLKSLNSRQEAEIVSLRTAKAEAIKELAERLKDIVVSKYEYTDVRVFEELDNLVEEMVGDV